MTKQDAKAGALRWIDEATVNGHAVAAEELADFRDRMDYLIGGVLAELGVLFPLVGTVQSDGGVMQLPADCRRVLRVVRSENGAAVDAAVRDGMMVLPQVPVTVIYERRPEIPAPDVPDTTVLDCAPGAEPLVPLKLAADLLIGTIDRVATAGYLTSRYNEMRWQLAGSCGDAPIAAVYTG